MCASHSSAQITFQKTYSGSSSYSANSVEQTIDGGYIIAGSTQSSGAPDDVLLIKTNESGDTLWTKILGGVNSDAGNSVKQTSDSGYIVAGSTYHSGVGYEDVYLIKTNGSGGILWTKTFGEIYSYAAGYSVEQTSDNGYIITGSIGFSDVYLVKTDSIGNLLWTRIFGGANDDIGYSVHQTNDGGYIIGGTTWSFGAGSPDVYLIRTDANGDTLWTKAYGGISAENCYSVQQTDDGGYIMAGSSGSFGSGFYDIYLIKTDANGDTLWTNIYATAGIDEGYSVQQTDDKGYIIAGYIYFGCPDGVSLIKTDSSGNALWTKHFSPTPNGYSDNNIGRSVRQTIDGGYIIAGQTYNYGTYRLEVYLIKTDSNGSSGCNEIILATTVTATATIVSNTATIVSSGGTESTPVTIISSGGTGTTICISTGEDEANVQENFISVSPNPFSSSTTISFSLQKNSTVSLEVFNLLGQKVKTMVQNEKQAAGKHQYHFIGTGEGIYFVTMKVDGISTSQKIICQK